MSKFIALSNGLLIIETDDPAEISILQLQNASDIKVTKLPSGSYRITGQTQVKVEKPKRAGVSRPRQATCFGCHRDFTSTTANTKYCSTPCLQSAVKANSLRSYQNKKAKS